MVIEPTTPSAELLTVAEFADKVNLTTQYIYKILNGKLAAYVTTVGNKKLISSEALILFTGESNTVDNNDSDSLLKSMQQSITILQQEIDLLTAQLAVKDEQLSGIIDRLHESHVITLQLTDRQQQLLQAAIDEAEAEATHTDTPEPPQTTPEQPVKQKWYQRLFVRRKPTK